ncbi:MAG: hypothetical protein JRI64_07210 [Deltaproteobacteria bacterium]|nr:hypothetical protein [Deltaproteobacteria bacterium]
MEVNVAILFFAGSALLAALILLRLRRKKRRSEHQEMRDRGDALERIVLLRSQFPAPADQQACDRIETEVKAVSRHFSMSTSIAPKKVYEMAEGLTREIAGIYYPDTDNPVLQASISDLLRLNERIVMRLNLKIREFPFNTVKDFSIHKILMGKDYYDSKIKNKLEWFKKYETLYKIGSHAWLSYNALNPWYWGRKFAYTSAREITFRYLLTWVTTIVGEEAMAVYGKRDINTQEAAFERDLAFAMVDIARTNKDISKEAYAIVLDHVLNKTQLSDAVRATVLRTLTVKAPGVKFAPTGTYTDKQTTRLIKNVKRVAAADGALSPEKREKLDTLERVLEIVSDDHTPL